MARAKKTKQTEASSSDVGVYKHTDKKRTNNPPAGIAGRGKVPAAPATVYSYDPHRPPSLRWDSKALPDSIPAILAAAAERALTQAEIREIERLQAAHQPWLEWTGKREKSYLEVAPVALHIHERVSAQAILKVAARQDVQRELFADPKQTYREAVQFYQHDVDWANRLILGDSLLVMNSLAVRERLAGKVQMIFMDPPYGINFKSNFQSEVGRRDVKENEVDLTRQPEMIKAYRDTWTLGIHTYLTYLRDRLIIARELLTEAGSIFVQISDENLHRVRSVMDEVFGGGNFCANITFAKTSGATGELLPTTCDYLLWYARDRKQVKFKPPLVLKSEDPGGPYSWVELRTAQQRRFDPSIDADAGENKHIFRLDNLQSQSQGRAKGEGAACWFPVSFKGHEWRPNLSSRWKTNEEGMARLKQAGRLAATEGGLYYVRRLMDFRAKPVNNLWSDTTIAGFSSQKLYVVETSPKVVSRCIFMTTEPGDLVLDCTSGSGTTAYVAEQYGRRWIAIDSSRVAITIARQRLLTASYPYYQLREEAKGVTGNFKYETIPHVTLKSIAQNLKLDSIFAKHTPSLKTKFAALNAALKKVSRTIRTQLQAKLAEKRRRRDPDDPVTEADERRWLLPKEKWEEWEVPFDTDPLWPEGLRTALTEYRTAWRAKMDEVDACIRASAVDEELVDRPIPDKKILRVSGPFTVEGVEPASLRTDDDSPIEGRHDALTTFEPKPYGPPPEPANALAHVESMVRLLRQDGVRFANNRQVKFNTLDVIVEGVLHAEGTWSAQSNEERRVAVAIGPEHGPVTGLMVEEWLRAAVRRGYDDLVVAGFAFDAEATAVLTSDVDPAVRTHLAHIRPDVTMQDLLKETPESQLFTVFGVPRTKLESTPDGQWTVTMEGVDVYDPLTGTIIPTGANKVAAWFLDSDYDGRTFCVCQAFFPDKNAWQKLARALKKVVDEDAFARFAGTVSVPFPEGEHRKVAVKVIDPRGNELMSVHALPGRK